MHKHSEHEGNDLLVYVAPRGFEDALRGELAYLGVPIIEIRERLFLCREPENFRRHPVWAQNIWKNPVFLPVSSISQATKALKALRCYFALHPTTLYRRGTLIQDGLPKFSSKAFVFGSERPKAPLGSWTLWEENELLVSTKCSSVFADGEVSFEENKTEPPGRAYLKLWEAFTLLDKRPKAGDVCIDLGSAPGGWTWVIAKLGAKVFSLDKSPLAPNVMSMPNVDFCIGSAFALEADTAGAVDWLFCDVACYPERLLTLVENWSSHGLCKNCLCTIKLQGSASASDYQIIDRFLEIPNSKIMHLSHNKHELTFFYAK